MSSIPSFLIALGMGVSSLFQVIGMLLGVFVFFCLALLVHTTNFYRSLSEARHLSIGIAWAKRVRLWYASLLCALFVVALVFNFPPAPGAFESAVVVLSYAGIVDFFSGFVAFPLAAALFGSTGERALDLTASSTPWVLGGISFSATIIQGAILCAGMTLLAIVLACSAAVVTAAKSSR